MISCQNYIEHIFFAHIWDTLKSKDTKNPSPIPDSCLKTIFQECGCDKGIVDTYKLKVSQGFRYHIHLGEMMHDCVTCHPDISYAITTMSKFLTKPSQAHY